MAGSAAGDTSRSKVATVLRVTSGNFLEMFDFFLFGFYATYISKSFFPVGSEFASLMLTFMTFGAGFLMRPLGAIFLGACLVGHLFIRARLPHADPYLYPLAALMCPRSLFQSLCKFSLLFPTAPIRSFTGLFGVVKSGEYLLEFLCPRSLSPHHDV